MKFGGSMKHYKITIIAALIILMALPAFGQRRKAPKDAKALLVSAKIEMLANPPRYEEALELLNRVLVDNGPVAEAFFRRGNIYGEFATDEYDPAKKLGWVNKMVIDFDSLTYTCDNEDIKKKYRKDCKKFLEKSDSVRVYFWRDNFMEGVDIIANIDGEHKPNYDNATDSLEKAAAHDVLKAASDSSVIYFKMAYAVDKERHEPLEGIGIVFDRLHNYDSSSYWFAESFKICPDSLKPEQATNTAYAYLQARNWEDALGWLKTAHGFVPEDMNIISNIAIVFNNMQQYDSALTYNLKVLELNPGEAGANFDVATFYLLKSQDINNEATAARKTDDKEAADKLMKNMNATLDTAITYFKNAFDAEPDNIIYVEQYATVTMIGGNHEDALVAFKRANELNPSKETLISEGDCYIQLQKFCEAIPPYEMALEEDPGDFKLLENLADLYESCKEPQKAKDARAKAKELRKM